ncbi:MAG TPA: ABC transporter permease [Blastocatellia bacterium]
MERFKILMARLRAAFRRESVLQDIEEELRVHVEMETDANIRRGMPPDEARAAAMKSFGDLSRKAELGYDVRGGGWLETLWQDLRYGARMLMKNPGFTLVAVAALALGIGANTAVFSVVNAILLQPLPFKDSDRLALIWTRFTALGEEQSWMSAPEYEDLQEQSKLFEEFALMRDWIFDFTDRGETEMTPSVLVSWNLFPMLGVKPAHGRSFLPDEDRRGAGKVVMMSYDFWRRRFGGDPSIVGKKIRLGGANYTVVGVLPAGFRILPPSSVRP